MYLNMIDLAVEMKTPLSKIGAQTNLLTVYIHVLSPDFVSPSSTYIFFFFNKKVDIFSYFSLKTVKCCG